MGADWSAFALIGLRVPGKAILKKKEEYENRCICDPQYKSEDLDIKFCPRCGQIIKFKIIDDIYSFEDKNGDFKIGEYKGVWATDRESLFFSIRIVEADMEYHNLLKSYEITSDEFEKFKDTMKEAGIWNKEEFGLWSILYCSY
ncbi:MAG: hypothetical protein V1663_01060 [archaeon]